MKKLMRTMLENGTLQLLILGTALSVMAAMTGCRSIEIENKGEGKGWTVDVFSHWMNSEADSISASVAPDGTVRFDMNGMKSTPSEEFNKMMGATMQNFTAMARLAASMYAPGAASVPLTPEPADPEAVAKLVAAQSAARTAEIEAASKREAARILAEAEAAAQAEAAKSASPGAADCPDGNCADVK